MVNAQDLAAIGGLINEFLRKERADRRGNGLALPDDLRARYAARLEGQDALLRNVRVVFVERLPDAVALDEKLAQLRIKKLSFSNHYEAMTFVDTILLATGKLGIATFGEIVKAPRERADATLLHELVHVVQYAALEVDPTSAVSIGNFTSKQIPDYLHHLDVIKPHYTYDQITFEDAACRTQIEYQAGLDPDGVAIAYECMDAKEIPYRKLELVAI